MRYITAAHNAIRRHIMRHESNHNGKKARHIMRLQQLLAREQAT